MADIAEQSVGFLIRDTDDRNSGLLHNHVQGSMTLNHAITQPDSMITLISLRSRSRIIARMVSVASIPPTVTVPKDKTVNAEILSHHHPGKGGTMSARNNFLQCPVPAALFSGYA